jgi:hypothetical protein
MCSEACSTVNIYGSATLKNGYQVILPNPLHNQHHKPMPDTGTRCIVVMVGFLFMVNPSVADPVSGAFLTPGSGMGTKSRSGIRDEHPESYF